MKNLYLVSAVSLNPIKRLLTELGAPIEALYEQALIPKKALTDESIQISWMPVRNIFSIVAKKYHIKNIGFLLAAKDALQPVLPYFDFVTKNTNDIESALQLFCDINKFTVNNVNLWLEKDNAGVWFCYAPLEYSFIGNDIIEEYSLAIMIEFIRYLTKPSWNATTIGLSRASIHYEDNHYLQGAQLSFSQPATRILIEEKILKQSINKNNAASINNAKTINIDNFTPLMVEQLTMILLPYFEQFIPNIENAAKITGLSKRSLQRYLNKEKLSYRNLIEQLRFEKAKTLLIDTNLTIHQISEKLHYSNYHNFSRAFSRWANSSPTNFRLNHR
ncbi:AraC family transcriptional regulator [Thalassotalea crassostreae]|uniref:AraC family transcriptional regulator n=1 Tax=Thalassotalea crassostreae TaxID=1763536 RepID=UPI00083924A5|nr:AraC family transcriptional regulator [Thalassotalea crassostreae]